MKSREEGISTTLAVVVVVVILAVASAVYFGLSSSTGPTPSTQSSSTTTIPLATLTTSTAAPTTTSAVPPSTTSTTTTTTTPSVTATPTTTSTTTTTTATAASSSLVPGTGTLVETFTPAVPIFSSSTQITYPFNIVTLGGTPNTLTLNASGPPGLTLTISPSTITMMGNNSPPSLMVSGQSSPSLAAGTYPVTITATGNGEIYSETQDIQVVKYLVVTVGATFSPENLTVPSGATITWLRLNGPLGCGCVDDGSTNVRFLNTTIASSGTLQQYQSFTTTFTKPGTFAYVCDFRAGETGTITVTP